jgi:hypothetical protein
MEGLSNTIAKGKILRVRIMGMVFTATFNNISAT